MYLRRTQYRYADLEEKSLDISRNMILGKIHNARQVLLRVGRDHLMQVDVEKVSIVTDRLGEYLQQVRKMENKDSLRGIEGSAAVEYFSVFNELVLR